MAAQATGERQQTRHEAVRDLIRRTFEAQERQVLKTQQYDAAPGSSSDPDRLYQPVADAALGRARCGRVLDGPELLAVVAYWTARSLARERQGEWSRQRAAGVAEGHMRFRSLNRTEARLWQEKDEACTQLAAPVQERLRRDVDPDLLLDLIREWAGLLDPSMRARMAAEHDRDARSLRKQAKGRPERGQPGVHVVLDRLHAAAIDRLTQHLAADDFIEH